jgi:hypothetical protein
MKTKTKSKSKSELRLRFRSLVKKIGHKPSGCCALGRCGAEAAEAARIERELSHAHP